VSVAVLGTQAIAETISTSVVWAVAGVTVKTMRLSGVGLSSVTVNKPVEASTVMVFTGSTVPSWSVTVYDIVFTFVPLKLKLTNSAPGVGLLAVIIELVWPSIRVTDNELFGITP
jgi:hypothetical protein